MTTATTIDLDDLIADVANREGGRIVLLAMNHHDVTCEGPWETCRHNFCRWVRVLAPRLVAADVVDSISEALEQAAARATEGGRASE